MAARFAGRFLELAKCLTAEVGLDHEAIAEDHPPHLEYFAIIERAWKEAREEQLI
jgi:hypothetical protein